MKVVMAKAASDRIRQGLSAQESAEAAVRELDYVQGSGGIIVVGPDGSIGMACNTDKMTRAWITAEGSGSAFLP